MSSRRFLRLAAIAAAVVAIGALLVGPASAGRQHVLVSTCSSSAYRPHTIAVFCADAGVVISRIHWNHWGQRTANGRGTAFTKTCDPDCLSGGVTRDSVGVRLTRRHGCANGRSYFLRITARYPAGNVLRHSLGCP
jgi:hypothetical protein